MVAEKAGRAQVEKVASGMVSSSLLSATNSSVLEWGQNLSPVLWDRSDSGDHLEGDPCYGDQLPASPQPEFVLVGDFGTHPVLVLPQGSSRKAYPLSIPGLPRRRR